jgi:lysophospholipase L1-like esterase
MKTRIKYPIILVVFFASAITICEAQERPVASQWNGKRAGYLGDSMTDPNSKATTKFYYQYLKEWLNIDHAVYARSGYQWSDIYKMAEKLFAEKANAVDAIFIWAGTNDYNHSIPLGEFFTETTKETNHNGKTVTRKYRTAVMSDSTFCGRVNRVLSFLKEKFPTKQIIILTPIHRGYATFSSTNVQPDENYANGQGLYLDTYVERLKQAGNIWSVPVIDLYASSGLYPNLDSQVQYISKSDTDRLHPSADGHLRIAKTIQYQLLALPADFSKEK